MSSKVCETSCVAESIVKSTTYTTESDTETVVEAAGQGKVSETPTVVCDGCGVVVTSDGVDTGAPHAAWCPGLGCAASPSSVGQREALPAVPANPLDGGAAFCGVRAPRAANVVDGCRLRAGHDGDHKGLNVDGKQTWWSRFLPVAPATSADLPGLSVETPDAETGATGASDDDVDEDESDEGLRCLLALFDALGDHDERAAAEAVADLSCYIETLELQVDADGETRTQLQCAQERIRELEDALTAAAASASVTSQALVVAGPLLDAARSYATAREGLVACTNNANKRYTEAGLRLMGEAARFGGLPSGCS